MTERNSRYIETYPQIMLAMEKEGEGDGRLVEEREREECMEKTVYGKPGSAAIRRQSIHYRVLVVSGFWWVLGGWQQQVDQRKKMSQCMDLYWSVLICVCMWYYWPMAWINNRRICIDTHTTNVQYGTVCFSGQYPCSTMLYSVPSRVLSSDRMNYYVQSISCPCGTRDAGMVL